MIELKDLSYNVMEDHFKLIMYNSRVASTEITLERKTSLK